MDDRRMQSLILAALNSVSPLQYEALDFDATVDEMGLDSLGLTQIILYIEDNIGGELDPMVLDRLAGAHTIGGFYEVLRDMPQTA